EKMAVWDPINRKLEFEGRNEDIQIAFWKGFCSVNEKLWPIHIVNVRKRMPEVNVLVQQDCTHEVVQMSDSDVSTIYIIDKISKTPVSSSWAIETEMNLVSRLKNENPHLHIESLNPIMCPCLTMNRIDLPHLEWCLDKIVEGNTYNLIKVDDETTKYSKE